MTCEEILKIGFDLLKEETDIIYGIDVKDQAESAVRMGGIVDTIDKLYKACKEDN